MSFITPVTLYTDSKMSRLVKEGSPQSAYILLGKNQAVTEKMEEKYGVRAFLARLEREGDSKPETPTAPYASMQGAKNDPKKQTHLEAQSTEGPGKAQDQGKPKQQAKHAPGKTGA